ncbi:MAG: hypothetical protein GXP27_15825 [Planctomycetes bacterium]|nr:hypothetical protein [Planctomycetota bacterium]
MKQTPQPLVLLFREVIGRPDADRRRVLTLLDENVASAVRELGTPRVDEDAPEWYQAPDSASCVSREWWHLARYA